MIIWVIFSKTLYFDVYWNHHFAHIIKILYSLFLCISATTDWDRDCIDMHSGRWEARIVFIPIFSRCSFCIISDPNWKVYIFSHSNKCSKSLYVFVVFPCMFYHLFIIFIWVQRLSRRFKKLFHFQIMTLMIFFSQSAYPSEWNERNE